MENFERSLVILSNVFFALKDFPSDCSDEELVKDVAGVSRYTNLALMRVVELVTKD